MYGDEELPYYLEWQTGEPMPPGLAKSVALLSQPLETQQLCRETGVPLEVVMLPYMKLKQMAGEKGVPLGRLKDCLGKEEVVRAMAEYYTSKDNDMMGHSSLLSIDVAPPPYSYEMTRKVTC